MSGPLPVPDSTDLALTCAGGGAGGPVPQGFRVDDELVCFDAAPSPLIRRRTINADTGAVTGVPTFHDPITDALTVPVGTPTDCGAGATMLDRELVELCDVQTINHGIYVPEFSIGGIPPISAPGTYTAPGDFPAGQSTITIQDLTAYDANDPVQFYLWDDGAGGANSGGNLTALNYANCPDGVYDITSLQNFVSGNGFGFGVRVTVAGGDITQVDLFAALQAPAYDIQVGSAFQMMDVSGAVPVAVGGPVDQAGAPYVVVGALQPGCPPIVNFPDRFIRTLAPKPAPAAAAIAPVNLEALHEEIDDPGNPVWSGPGGNLHSVTLIVREGTIEVDDSGGNQVDYVAGETMTWSVTRGGEFNSDQELNPIARIEATAGSGGRAVVIWTEF